jgi:hypothetical protein
MASYLFRPAKRVVADDPTKRLCVNDPVFFRVDDVDWKQVGYVMRVDPADTVNRITLSWYDEGLLPERCELIQFYNSGRLEEVIATLLPPQKQRLIQERLAEAMSQHGDELSAAFVPLVQQTIRHSMPVIEEEFKKSINAHRDAFDALAARWNEEIIDAKILPLARQEIIPILRQHGQPPAEEIGRELWDRASLFRFGWRAVYDNAPLPRRDLVREEWDRFVEQEAVPVFESHMDEIVIAVQRIVQDVAANEVVRGELGEVVEQVAADPETQQLLRTIMNETLVENERLRQVWSGVWQSDRARQALNLAGDRLEPVVRQIGDDLFGTREGGIDPDFARVLRTQILGKDRRFVVARLSDTPSDVIHPSNQPLAYPIIYTVDKIELEP